LAYPIMLRLELILLNISVMIGLSHKNLKNNRIRSSYEYLAIVYFKYWLLLLNYIKLYAISGDL